MNCPHCGHEKSRVTETRAGADADRRIRLCLGCARTFQTLERVCVFAGRAAGYVEVSAPEPVETAVLAMGGNVVRLQQPEQPAEKPAAANRAPTAKRQEAYVADLDDAGIATLTEEARPLIVEWWNVSRRSKHGAKAAWTFPAFHASLTRLSQLPNYQQVLLAQAGVEHGWQALKTEYLKEELAKPSALGRPMPKDPAMLAALEQWPSQPA